MEAQMRIIIWKVYYRNEGLLANTLLPAIILQTGNKTGRFIFPFHWFMQPVYIP
jgi:hypothetical protein